MVSIDGKEPIELQHRGFVSSKVGHAHLLKHVVRIARSVTSSEPEPNTDPERWSDLISDPPLPGDFDERRRQVRQRLQEIPDCYSRSQLDNPCEGCDDSVLQSRVDNELGDMLGAYEAVARKIVRWAFDNQTQHRPRLVSFKHPAHPGVRLVVEDPQAMVAIAGLDPRNGVTRTISCFRRVGPKRSYRQRWLEMSREQAGHMRSGAGVDLRVVPKEMKS